MRSWQVIKLGEEDHAAPGILIQGPRCENEKLVALSDVVEFLRDHVPHGPYWERQIVANEIERKFGGHTL